VIPVVTFGSPTMAFSRGTKRLVEAGRPSASSSYTAQHAGRPSIFRYIDSIQGQWLDGTGTLQAQEVRGFAENGNGLVGGVDRAAFVQEALAPWLTNPPG
jgi:hypothetical protein